MQKYNKIKMQDRQNIKMLLKETGRFSDMLVSCKNCTKCCEKGIVYVLPDEKEHLEKIGVPLIEIEKIQFIKRNQEGSCAMLDKDNNRCTIYTDRPFCCRIFPFDIFSRRGQLEWSVYTYCYIERVKPVIYKNGMVEIDYDVLSLIAYNLEKYLSENVLKFLAKEDKVIAQAEFLDEYRNEYKILGPVLKKVEL